MPFADLHVVVRLPQCVTNAAFDTLFDTLTETLNVARAFWLHETEPAAGLVSRSSPSKLLQVVVSELEVVGRGRLVSAHGGS